MALQITDLGGKAGELKFYGSIGTWFINSETFQTAFADAEKRFDTITIRIHSYGGQVFEGSVIYNTIAKSSKNVNIIIDGVAASMASIVMLAAKKVSIVDNGFVMIHCPSTYTSGNAAQHTEAANLLNQLESNFKSTYAAKTGKPESEIAKYLDGADHWLSAKQALALGLVDEIIPAKAFVTDLDAAPNDDANQEQIYNRYKAVATTAATVAHTPTNIQIDNTMKQLIIATFGFANLTADSSDTAVIAALKEKMDALKKEANDARAAAIDAALVQAGLEGDAAKPFKEIGEKAGITAMVAVLPKTATPAQTTTPSATPGSITAAMGTVAPTAQPDASKTWDWYQKNEPKALQAMADAKVGSAEHTQFVALYKAEFGTEPAV